MATTQTRNPFMGSVTATTTAQSIWDLLSVLRTQLPKHVCYVKLSNDVGSGGNTLFIGDIDVSSTNYGIALIGSQATDVLAFDSNLIVLTDVFVRAQATTIQVNLVVVAR